MMSFRRLEPKDCDAFCRVSKSAYPGFADFPIEKLFKHRMDHPDDFDTELFGAFEDDKLLGSWRTHDFTMTFRGQNLPVLGLGGVAVDLPFKKQKVCLQMVEQFHRQALEQGRAMTLLYPFRASFYQAMGYGMASHLYRHTVRVTDLPAGDKSSCGWIEDREEWLAYFNTYASRTHGMIRRPQNFGHLAQALGFPKRNYVGVWRDGSLHGAMELAATDFAEQNPFRYHFTVKELLADEPCDLHALLAFLRAQEDQTQTVVLHSFDPDFGLAFQDHSDPTHEDTILEEFHIGESKGYGLMARVVDCEALLPTLKACRWGRESFELVFELHDSLLTRNHRSLDVVVEEGRWTDRAASSGAARIRMDIAEFSSLLMGASSLRALHRYGRLSTTDEALLPLADRAFAVETPPECWTVF